MSLINLVSLQLTQTLTLILFSLPSLINTSQLDYDTLVFKQCDSLHRNILHKTTESENPNRNLILASFLRKLESESSWSNFYKTLIGNEEYAVSGWFQCRNDYPTEICHRCVSDLREISFRLCGNATSARVHLRGCYLMYRMELVDGTPSNHHSYTLLEKSEHGLIHKICDGVTAETFAGLDEMRREALTAAAAGVVEKEHGFYEDSYKLLHVVAQCQGNVRNDDCGECVSAAAAVIEEECRWSVAGQIYMDGCYVAYTYYPDKIHADSYHEGKEVNVGKSVAIVVGVAAALVFGAIFVMFLKSLGKKGDDC